VDEESWEADVDDALASPPTKGYSLPPEAGGGGDDDEDGGERVPCALCGRHFNADRVAKHEQVCAKQQASDAKRQAKIAAKAAKLPKPGSQKSADTEAWKSKRQATQRTSVRLCILAVSVLISAAVLALCVQTTSSKPQFNMRRR